MAGKRSVTPLIALDAVVIDTETTGLDPRKALIVEIAAVRLAGGRLQPKDAFRRLVCPGEPIPALASGVHGINDAAVADAPPFADIWPELSSFIGDAVVIGHALGFDLAVLKRECERAGIEWTRPHTLDTRLLAEVAEPYLAGYSLDSLAAWLGVEITDRHSALGDALACARIFLALLPKLREGGIRTLAEAERACRALTDVLDQQHRAGWVETVGAPSRIDTERTLRRFDSYPYRHRVRDIMRSPPRFVAADNPVRDTLARLMKERISSFFVRTVTHSEQEVLAQNTGIVTERDLLRAVATHGAAALDMPIDRFMSKPLITVPADAFVYRAIGRMSRVRIRHLGAIDEAGVVVGALSARDLLRLRAGEAISLGDEIDQAEDAHALAVAWAKLPHVAAALLGEGLAARDIASVISREVGALTRQAGVLAERRMRDDGKGDPPCRYAVAVLGSAGRGESLLAMDQDNALVFAQGEPGGGEDLWFEAFGGYIADILHEAGVPYCPGGVMAKNAPWRGSLSTWQTRVDDWIGRSNPQDLLSVDIFFDLRAVHGEVDLATRLREYALNAAKGQAAFAKLLSESAGKIEPGLNFMRGFRTERGRINLKKAGLFGIVTAARALAICHHVVQRSTSERLASLKGLGIGGEADLDAMIEAQSVFLDLILAQQIEDVEHGTPAMNSVAVKRLSKSDQTRLRTSLRAVEQIEEFTRDHLFKD
ncbi:MAG: CBS domain-containing protein [Rhizobiales bacterium]|nr:CBS domain-containing protein [Hyphomicrobiales bacterium]